MNNINELKLVCEGGIGLIFETLDNNIIKLLLISNIYNNNIKYFNKLNNKIPITQINKYNIKTFNYNNISNKNIKDYLIKKNDILLNIYKQKIVDLKLYFINYKKYDTNLYSYILFLKHKKKYKELYNNLVFIIYWLLITIVSLDDMNICHNDFKLDNILIQFIDSSEDTYLNFDINKDLVDLRNKNNRFINFNNNYSLFNNININLYLNDFDKTYNYKDKVNNINNKDNINNNDNINNKDNINSNDNKDNNIDLTYLKLKLFQIFEVIIKPKDKDKVNKDFINIKNLIVKLINKLEKTNSISDIKNLWIENSTTYLNLNIYFNLITNYLNKNETSVLL